MGGPWSAKSSFNCNPQVFAPLLRRKFDHSIRWIKGVVRSGSSKPEWKGVLHQPWWGFEVVVDVRRPHHKIRHLNSVYPFPSHHITANRSGSYSTTPKQLGHDRGLKDHVRISRGAALTRCVLLLFYFNSPCWGWFNHWLAVIFGLYQQKGFPSLWRVFPPLQTHILQSFGSSGFDSALGDVRKRAPI